MSEYRCCGFVGCAKPRSFAKLVQPMVLELLKVNQSVKVESAYLGQVEIQCTPGVNPDILRLEAVIDSVALKVIDSQQNKLDVNQPMSAEYLVRFPAAKVSLTQCRQNDVIITRLRLKQSQEGLTESDMQELHRALIYNNPVDVHFNTCNFIRFCSEILGLKNPVASNFIASIVDVRRFDNAFFAPGKYMVYGNGNRLFYPMGTVDITGHELGHSIVDMVTHGLAYSGHSAALHEGFADCFGAAFEFYLYNKYNRDASKTNDIKGDFDWLMGEDNGKTMGPLRFLADPQKAKMPSVYRGEFWVDPNSKEDQDYGGAHTNCSIVSLCFYKCCQRLFLGRVLETIQFFYKVLGKLCLPGRPVATFIDFRDRVRTIWLESLNNALEMDKILLELGLGPTATNDWLEGATKPATGKKRSRVA